MACVVFFRAVNVGGHQKFQPSVLARELAEFGVVNVGAAGTFVVRAPVSQARLRAEILRRLPFRPELMICRARDVLALARGSWFRDAPGGKDIGRFVSVMQKSPQLRSKLPIEQPVLRAIKRVLASVSSEPGGGRMAPYLQRILGHTTAALEGKAAPLVDPSVPPVKTASATGSRSEN